MKRVILSLSVVLAAGVFLAISLGASNGKQSLGTYKIQLDNAFGLVQGADFKVAGVKAGKISSLDLDQRSLHALVTVDVTQPGLGPFRTDAFCQTRPQSLIGEYFVECQPGHSGQVLKSGSTIPVTRTQSTIPGDLLQNVQRLPYRERFTLIINELGAAVAGRSGDLAEALRRAVPALTETDNLLNQLANDSGTLAQLTTNSDSVVTALANNSTNVQRFIDEANRAATATAVQSGNLAGTFKRLPAFLEQLRPSLAKLGVSTDANLPVLRNLSTASGQLNRLFTDLPPFARSSLTAFRALGQASITGKSAVQAAGPTVAHLNAFAKPVPELAQNLAIVLRHLDNRSFATEKDPRSPGGQGYTGLEALLQYVFNQAVAINTFGPFGHVLAVDAFADPQCSPYATPETLASNLKMNAAAARKCYSWLGPNQPGINEKDPSNPGGAVPDPGGAPPGHTGPAADAARLAAPSWASPATAAAIARGPGSKTSNQSASPGAGGDAGSAPSGAGGGSAGFVSTVQQPLQQILNGITGGSSGAPAAPGGGSGGSGGSATQTKQLLNYLLAP